MEELGVELEVRDIVTQTPSKEELARWMEQGNLELKKLYNVSGNLYKEWNMKERRETMSKEEQLQLLSENGMLIKRPLLIGQKQVLAGYREAQYEAFAEAEQKG